MDKLKEMFEKLPKWAKIGLPIIAAVLIVYVIYKNKSSSSSSTLSEPAVGTADSGTSTGASTDSGSSSDTTTTDKGTGLPSTINVVLPGTPDVTPAVSTSPKHTPEMAQPAEIKLAAHWAAQAAKNAKKAGVKVPATSKPTSSMTEAQATADYEHNKGIAQGLAAKHTTTHPATVTTKSRTVAVSHKAPSKKESPKKAAPKPAEKVKK
jgi:hypothetical protein